MSYRSIFISYRSIFVFLFHSFYYLSFNQNVGNKQYGLKIMITTNQIRDVFLDYFKKNGHQEIPSSSLIPNNDPTLMFTNAGMVQFKNIFVGHETAAFSKAVTSQKCVRAGGKHNDLENVGYTARHHTFFEMLGNFSFGDYFKEQAIFYAWDMVTKELQLPKEKLYVTIYHDDDDAFSYWKKIAQLPDDRIIRIATKDNFWQMGSTGPCGPCSEIFYDHGDHIWGGLPGTKDEDGDRFIEIWNLVFMQFEQFEDQKRITLPKPSIDTGMGLERIAAVLQNKHNNYDIDLMRHIIDSIAGSFDSDPDGAFSSSHKVIADHLRSSAFLMADGVMPSNEGRGYVLRRIMRRAMRHAHKIGRYEQQLHTLFSPLISTMGQHYTELKVAESFITETMKSEEQRFHHMLERGLKLLDKEIEKLGSKKILSGDIAFSLYDTYGFPLDLTEDVLRGYHVKLDHDGFAHAMQQQKDKARQSWSGTGVVADDTKWFAVKEKIPFPDFLGYHHEKADAIVTAILNENFDEVSSVTKGEVAWIMTNQTPFYGESGGQKGDTGTITCHDTVCQVMDTKKFLGDMIAHHVKVTCGAMAQDDAVSMAVDSARRKRLRANHSATHLLHKALRDVLGHHVTQKGSLVGEESLRFDFSHHIAVSEEELAKIEREVNQQITRNTRVVTKVMHPDDAKKEGALALFGEKYGSEVRVLKIGEKDQLPYSVELCGGTHVNYTGDIGFFGIISEESVASGIRRITAVTHDYSVRQFRQMSMLLSSLNAHLRTTDEHLSERIMQLLQEKKAQEKNIHELEKKIAEGSLNGNSHALYKEKIGEYQFFAQILENYPAKDLKTLADTIKKRENPDIIVLISTVNTKCSIVIAVQSRCTTNISAVDLVKIACEKGGGKGGGGRADMAQGGFPNSEIIPSVVKAVQEALL